MSKKPLGEIATFIRGITFKPEEKCDPFGPQAVACMRTSNVQAELDQSDLIGVPRSLVKNDAKILRSGDILVSSANSWNLVGKCCWVPDLKYEATAGGFISILRGDRNQILPRYLFHWFSSAEVQNTVRSFGNQTTNISNLNHNRCLELAVPLPSLAEQKRIAAILDAADELRAKRRESLVQLDTLLQSTFLDLFGDPVANPGVESMPIEDVIEKIIDYRGKSPEKTTSGVPLITAKIVKNREITEATEFIAESAYSSWMRRGIPMPGSVIITTEAPMGEVALVPNYQAAFAQRLLVLEPNYSVVDSYYLMWCLTMPYVKRQMDQKSTGSTVTGIRSKEFRKVLIPTPPLKIQHSFRGFAESTEAQRARYREQLEELDSLFASLQSRAFRGEL